MAPLQADLQREKKRLRLNADAVQRLLDLDLRKPNDREKSRLFRRLNLISIPWGVPERVFGGKGTFHEAWRLRWDPVFEIQLIEAGIWGSVIQDAADAKTCHDAEAASELAALANLVEEAILAELPRAAGQVMDRLQNEAAIASDVTQLMDALPPLAEAWRYGDARGTDPAMVERVTDGLIARIAIGLPGACASLDDEAAAAMFQRLIRTNGAIVTMEKATHLDAWKGALRQLAGQEGIHGLIGGRGCRLLLDHGTFDSTEVARRMSLALSSANDPAKTAAWIEGFLSGSGALLAHHDALRGILDRWVTGLRPDSFQAALPLLRRTFSSFQPHERRQIGERLQGGSSKSDAELAMDGEFDAELAKTVLPLAARLLGLDSPEEGANR
jgi:hypothetical protein